jgi:Lon protease-like protein
MSRYIPLFPLNIVVFPGEKLNLHIFEPRYKQLISDCQEGKATFGIPPYLTNSIGSYGTEIKILSIEKNYPGGEMDIKTKGIGIFRIIEFERQMAGKSYAGGTIEAVENIDDEDILDKEKIVSKLHDLYEVLKIDKLFMDLPADFKIFDIAHHLGLSVDQEYAMLQLQHESQRQELILNHLDKVLPVLSEVERLKERIKLNGHFKNLTPPSF